MLTVGGAISGYSLIGMISAAMIPTIVMRTEMTVAKIGRSMKKCGNFIASLMSTQNAGADAVSVGYLFDLAWFRSDLGTWPDHRIGDSINDHAVGHCQSRLDHPQSLIEWTERHGL